MHELRRISSKQRANIGKIAGALHAQKQNCDETNHETYTTTNKPARRMVELNGRSIRGIQKKKRQLQQQQR